MIISLVRHAKAASRRTWSEPDIGRPLDAKGHDQARTIADLLYRRPVGRGLSSPALRCRQTVGPLGDRLGLHLELHDALAEGTSGERALELVDALAAGGADAVVCSHGDVIPEVIDRLAGRGVLVHGPRACAKGSTWDLEVLDGVIVAARYVPLP